MLPDNVNVRIWWFDRKQNVLEMTRIKRISKKEFLSYFDENLISITNNGDYFAVRIYARGIY